MAMALSLGGGGRRRWSCRAGRRGNGGAGCRHFHVHYHIPRQVWAFSPSRLPPRFLLLPYLLILPVLFLAVLAFLVFFGWLTLVYLASSLWSRSVDRAGDANEFGGEDEREERPLKLVTEHAGHSGLSEVCVEGKEIREAEDGVSEESQHISRMASTDICITDDEEKIVKEVILLERNLKGSKAFAELDGSTEKHDQLVMDIPVDCFLDEPNTKEFSTSINDTMKLLDVLSIGQVFDADTKEISVLGSTEILKFIDKHDTAEILVNGAGTDFVIPEVTSSDDSTTYVLGDKYMKEIKQKQSPAELSVDTVPDKLPADVTDEWQETQTLVIEHNNKQPEAASNEEYRKRIVGISDEFHDSVCEMAGLPLDSASENISENATASKTPLHQTNSDKDIEHQEDLIQNKRVESSTSASAVCDFADSHWRIIEELDGFANEENIHEAGTSVLETVQDEDEDIDNYASMVSTSTYTLVIFC
jgi:tRNA A37 threonylcarbamoyladenosine synthetase subunit TsaC/SUA5/YrdC